MAKMITTQGRARQKTLTLARQAGIEVNAVCFTRPQLIKTLGHVDGKRFGTKKDTAWGRCWLDEKVIWFSLPVSLNTIVHELAHLTTSAGHYTKSFEDKVMALKEGRSPKPQWYEITLVQTITYRVRDITASLAKKHIHSDDITNKEQSLTARRVK